jgi:hypothetical protein
VRANLANEFLSPFSRSRSERLSIAVERLVWPRQLRGVLLRVLDRTAWGFAEARVRGGAVGERLFATGLCLPSGSNLRDDDQARVIDALRSTPRRRSK